jgi:hypothetical protein
MALTVPNLPDLTKKDPKLGEALQRVQAYLNNNVAAAPQLSIAGNKKQPPTFVTPGVVNK